MSGVATRHNHLGALAQLGFVLEVRTKRILELEPKLEPQFDEVG